MAQLYIPHLYSATFSSLETASTPISLGEDQQIQAKGPSINLEPEIVPTENYAVLNPGKILEERQGIGQIFSSEASGRQQPEALILQHGGQNGKWPEKSQEGNSGSRSYSIINTLVGQGYPRQGAGAEFLHKQVNYYYENSAAGIENISERPQVINNFSSNTDFLHKNSLMSENVYGADQRHVRPRLHEGEIVEVEGGHIIRSVGRKDRHSKVYTAKGPRDRRVRLSALTAIQFYDVQDRLGYDRPSKAVDWLIKNAKSAIDELHQLNPSSSKRSQPQSSNNIKPRDDHHQFQFPRDHMAMNSRSLARDRARERTKERNSITNTLIADQSTNNFSKFPQQQQQQSGDHNFNNDYDHQPNNVLLHQKDNNKNNNNDGDNSNSDQCHGSTKAQSLNSITAHDHQHDGDQAMHQNHDQMMSSIQSYLNLPNALFNQAADLRLSLMQRPSVQYLSLLQNPTTANYLDMLRIRPGQSHHRVMRQAEAPSASSGFDPSTLSHHNQYPGFGILPDHRRYNNYNNNSSNNVVLQSDHHHYDESGLLQRHQYNFFTSGSHINTVALRASPVENHDDQNPGYAATIAFPAVRGTLQSINGTAAAPASARSIPASISVSNRSNINRATDNNIEQHHDHGCNSIEENAGAFPVLIHGFPHDHEDQDQDDMKPSTC